MQFDTPVDSETPESRKMTEYCPHALSQAGNGGGGAFFITVSWVLSWFIKIDLNQFIPPIPATRKVRMFFYNFCYYW